VAPMDIAFAFTPPCEGSGTKVGATRMRVLVVEVLFLLSVALNMDGIVRVGLTPTLANLSLTEESKSSRST